MFSERRAYARLVPWWKNGRMGGCRGRREGEMGMRKYKDREKKNREADKLSDN